MKNLWQRLDDFVSKHGLTTAAIGLFGGALVLGLIGHLRQYGALDPGRLVQDFYTNLASEMVSIATTVLILDWLARKREAKREEEELKEDLAARLDSRVNDVALRAAEELRRHGWLTDGTLCGADLYGANLERAALHAAMMQETILTAANLQFAVLRRADLQCANLEDADLECAELHGADLRGASLRGADLLNTIFENTAFDNNTILPDGHSWKPGADLGRFTNATHPDYWRSDNRRSPAFRQERDLPKQGAAASQARWQGLLIRLRAWTERFRTWIMEQALVRWIMRLRRG